MYLRYVKSRLDSPKKGQFESHTSIYSNHICTWALKAFELGDWVVIWKLMPLMS